MDMDRLSSLKFFQVQIKCTTTDALGHVCTEKG
jgi:hypothetical protein